MESAAQLTYLVAMAGGVLSFLSPCVLPLVPSYLSVITGMSIGELSAGASVHGNRWRVALYALGFIAGFSVIFMALGTSFSVFGQLLLGNLQVARRAAGLLILLFGLHLTGVLRVPRLLRGWRFDRRPAHASVPGAFGLGAAFAVGWTPCIGPVLGSILFLAGTADQAGRGTALLAAYSLGLGIPFFLSALALGSFLRFFQRFRWALPWVDRSAGLLLIVMGVLVFTGYMTILNSYLISLTPAWLWKYL
ncbi:MAG: cytochrome c biogenesis CcdA family protein [Candidatus Methylomirabilia bacterium]